MILDRLGEFGDAASVIGVAGHVALPNVVDITNLRDVGHNARLYLMVLVASEIFTGGVAGTIEFEFVSHPNATPAADGSDTVHYASGAIATAAEGAGVLQAGETAVAVQVPMEGIGSAYQRYLSVLANIGTTPTTGGAVNAFFTFDPQVWKAQVRATD